MVVRSDPDRSMLNRLRRRIAQSPATGVKYIQKAEMFKTSLCPSRLQSVSGSLLFNSEREHGRQKHLFFRYHDNIPHQLRQLGDDLGTYGDVIHGASRTAKFSTVFFLCLAILSFTTTENGIVLHAAIWPQNGRLHMH